MDYYKILSLTNGASEAEIKKAYRKLAIQWHPKRNENKSKELVESKFEEISVAYCVLSDAKLRAVFDQYGDKGLRDGATSADGGSIPPWNYNKNPESQFNDFFGSFSPFADFFSEEAGYTNLFSSTSKASGGKLPSTNVNLYCTLEELFSGCTKNQKVTRKKLKMDGKGTTVEERTITVDIEAGWREGTKITFTGEGDEAKGATTGDVVFTLKETPHNYFTRNKNNLEYTATITLVDSLVGTTVRVKTLDGRVLNIPINELVQPGYVKVVPGEGMKKPNSNTSGDLLISFNIVYPEFLTAEQKTKIKETLN